jgi:hypothetical protein
MYLFTAGCFAITTHLRATGDIDSGIGRRINDAGHSHVRHFKQQARKFLACPASCSVWPPLGKAGGTIMKRRLIML